MYGLGEMISVHFDHISKIYCNVTHWNRCNFDVIFITCCTANYHLDNFQCSQWWKFYQNDDIFVSVCWYNIYGMLYIWKPYRFCVIKFSVYGIMTVWLTKMTNKSWMWLYLPHNIHSTHYNIKIPSVLSPKLSHYNKSPPTRQPTWVTLW